MAGERHDDHVLAGSFAALADGVGDFVGLAVAEADFAFVVADDDERAEGEVAAAFDDLGAAVDADDDFFSVGLLAFLFGRSVFSGFVKTHSVDTS